VPRQETGVAVHLVNCIGVDIYQRTERVHRVDLRERIKKAILFVRSQSAVILADAQLVAELPRDRKLMPPMRDGAGWRTDGEPRANRRDVPWSIGLFAR
jgi:hypothetical protein